MPWSILWTDQALRDMSRLDPPVARRIIAKVEQTTTSPLRFFSRLVASDEYKLRVGDYRLLAALDSASQTILGERVDHRSRAYTRRESRRQQREPCSKGPLSRPGRFRVQMPEDFVITPWDVKDSVDYDRLVTQ